MEEKERVLDGEVPVLIWVPKDTVGISVKAKILNSDFTFSEAVCDYDYKEFSLAREDGDKWDEENTKYVINYDRLKDMEIDIDDC